MVAAVVRGEVHQSVGLLPDLSDGLHDPADTLVHLPDGVPVAAVEATSPPPDSEMYQNIRMYKFQIGVLKKQGLLASSCKCACTSTENSESYWHIEV